MGIISVEHMDRLYWLGRYSERVYSTLKFFSERYDTMIDMEENAYEEYCRRQEIPNIYTSSEDFVSRYCFDKTDVNSIFSNLMRAYDNAIVLREEIGSETLAYIQLAVYAMNKAKESDAPLIPLMSVKDDIVAFWGIADDQIDSEYVRNIIKVGKRIERIDLYARMHYKASELVREVRRLTGRIDRTGLSYNHANLMKLNYFCEMDELDYKEIVKTVEALV
ncbi:MAG: alpha-E domain-containing protein [Clostridium sp.]|nr:alpha-E domain-containing protein [Clostridium sp.]MCM1288204.1 alpha-E domain-containing protein [Clostridium sp.]